MSETRAERLQVRELFYFEDGTTVLVGEYEGRQSPITTCHARVTTEGMYFADVVVTGERMPGPRTPSGWRTIATKSLSAQHVAELRMAKSIVVHIMRNPSTSEPG